MKKSRINLGKSRAKFLIMVLIMQLILQNFAYADGWSSSEPYHQTLYIDTLTSKTENSAVNIADSEGLFVTTDIKVLGNIGIGVLTPAQKLDVAGQIHSTGDICTDAAGGKCLSTVIGEVTSYWNASGNDVFNLNSGNVGIGVVPTAKLHLGGTSGVDGIKFPDGTLQTTAATDGASDLSCSNCVALETETSGTYDNTSDTIADDGTISSAEVDFNYAGSSIKGGTAATASALAANGANCAPGSYPLGVDESGAAESCTAAAGAIPSGMIAFFVGACPSGWTEYTSLRGRVILGMPSGGTSAGTVGTALGNLASRTITDVPAHSHSVDPPATASGGQSNDHTHSGSTSTDGSHTHGINSRGFSPPAGQTDSTVVDNFIKTSWGVGYNTNGAGSHSHSFTTGGASAGHTHTTDIAAFSSASSGSASVDVTMPYIQLTGCQKN